MEKANDILVCKNGKKVGALFESLYGWWLDRDSSDTQRSNRQIHRAF